MKRGGKQGRRENRKPENYDAYMASPEWGRVRLQVFKRDGYKCKACSNDGRLEAHHISYSNFGNENLHDIVALCKACHSKVHAYQRQYGKGLREATQTVIKLIQNGEEPELEETPKGTVKGNGVDALPSFIRMVQHRNRMVPACLGKNDTCGAPQVLLSGYCWVHHPDKNSIPRPRGVSRQANSQGRKPTPTDPRPAN